MSQARVTDFFSQRKKSFAGPRKPGKQYSRDSAGTSTRPGSAQNKDDVHASSHVHEEFLRVIDEASGLNDVASSLTKTAKCPPSSPRTPKRDLAETQFDLGAAVFSADTAHSTAKKRRQTNAFGDAEVKVLEKAPRGKARKKLVLSAVTRQDASQSPPSEVSQQPAAPSAPECRQNADKHEKDVTENNRKQSTKALCKEDITALKSHLQRIKTLSQEKNSTASSLLSPATPTSNKTTCCFPKLSVPSTAERTLKFTIQQAKELAAKAQRRNEEKLYEESKQSQTQTPDSYEQPAYQRFHTLSQAVPPGLSLPYQYKLLAEMFRSMDTVVAMMYNRCESATFAKVKQGVQDMMHKRFEESHVGQIKTVFPEAYTFRQEKNILNIGSCIKKGSYQLTIEPFILSDQNEACPILSASRLLERRHIFHLNLISIVKHHHKVFLSSLVPPVSVPDDKLTRWHPCFNVDTVPSVQTSLLPQPPLSEKLATAQEVLAKAGSFLTPKMEKALVSLVLKGEDKTSESKEPTHYLAVSQISPPAAPPATQVPTVLKGVSQSLLERIRTKEAQKLQAAMTRNPSQEERLLMMSRLGELARILRSVFVAEKKPSLIMEVACNRMVASYRSALSTGEMEKHIRLLAEVAADWLTIHPIRKDFYLKLNKNMELNIVLEKLTRRLKEEERRE
ncbi:DNA replication factor Cdt1 [Echeneis naucrates]|uniref:DNA replication factor Cdt1 n=1 Tax=Echeneis naucrates TaxID=173247 RepID=UPI0011141302|nr:DNA replication factor Cdt1 [Echeneis naucrates]